MTSFTMVLLSQVISVRYDFHTYVTILVGISEQVEGLLDHWNFLAFLVIAACAY